MSNYRHRNPYILNSKLSARETEAAIRMFCRGETAAHTAREIGRSARSISILFRALRERISIDGAFYNRMHIQHMQLPDGTDPVWKMIDQCFFRCPTNIAKPKLDYKLGTKTNSVTQNTFYYSFNKSRRCSVCPVPEKAFQQILPLINRLYYIRSKFRGFKGNIHNYFCYAYFLMNFDNIKINNGRNNDSIYSEFEGIFLNSLRDNPIRYG